MPRATRSKQSVDWLVVGTWVLAVGTLLLAGITYCTFKDAQNTAARQLRAYVSLDTQSLSYPPRPETPNRYAISLVLNNTGKTWARKVVVAKKDVLDSQGDPFNFLKWDSGAPIVLGPGQILKLQFGEIQFSEVPKIHDTTKKHDFVAWVKYEDAVSSEPIVRQTQMSLHLNGDSEGNISFSYNPTHNCAEEDCH